MFGCILDSMKKALFWTALALACGCGSPESGPGPASATANDKPLGKVILYDSGATNVIATNAQLTIIGRHYKWCEGPVWVPAQKMLLFSAVKENKVYKWDGKDSPVAFLSPSGYTDTAFRDGENGSNGLALDKDGRLLLCQSGNRQVVRLATGLDSPRPEYIIIAPTWRTVSSA